MEFRIQTDEEIVLQALDLLNKHKTNFRDKERITDVTNAVKELYQKSRYNLSSAVKPLKEQLDELFLKYMGEDLDLSIIFNTLRIFMSKIADLEGHILELAEKINTE